MGLDIYAGTLTRYYSRNWKNKVQQIAEANGQKCEMTDGLGNKIKPVEDAAEIMEIRDIVCQWSEELAANIEHFNPPMPHKLWDENNESEYYTDKPDWEAYGALVMLMACHLHNYPLPEYVENGWNAFDNPVVKRCISQKINISLLSNVVIWLPIEKESIYTTVLPNGEEANVSTLQLLKQELEELNRQIWKADEPTILSWRDDKYYIPTKQNKSKPLFGLIITKGKKEKYRTEDLAQCAYSILYQAVNFAMEHKVPLLLDY